MFQTLSKHGQTLRSLLSFEASINTAGWHVSLFLVLLGNFAFWQAASDALGYFSLHNIALIAALAVLMTALINLLITIIGFKYIFKPLIIILLLCSAVASYFMQRYGVMLDITMMQNVIETDPREATELFSAALFAHLLIFGAIPALIIARTRILYKPWPRELLARAINLALTLCVIGATSFAFYKDLVSFGRNHNELRHLINPLNYLHAIKGYGKQHWVQKRPVSPLGEDAHLLTTWPQRGKKNLVILIVGETARASNFSLNGYTHNTNPNLARQDIINFSNAWSCGTATAVSVPCMFSNLGREHYTDDAARHQENILDVLQHAGVQVAWRDNNSGCKGLCARVDSRDLSHEKHPQLCANGECYDDILFDRLQQYVDHLQTDSVIVLHQKGSHGPTYHLRYPQEFAVFKPACNSNQLDECSREEVVNVYDNTILYTDHVLNGVIEFLQQNSQQFNTAMLYMSDHGESLGEEGLYLHGLPYFMAPDEQKHIPFIVWLSDQYAADAGIDKTCLKANSHEFYSHDNLFHSMLGLMDVDSATYNPGLDVFAPCNRNTLKHIAHIAHDQPTAN
ncbi:MAG: lipid ethanolaminephosphotransferase [Pseudomonadota bacterium]|nr:lipid ethanolaminephosphotransferase [Pseudomonadota bacterium]